MEDTATKEKGRRASPRNQTIAAIQCQPYTSSGAVRASDGVMCNFSSEGIYIETAYKYKPGSIILVRVVNYQSNLISSFENKQPRSISLAKVKWNHSTFHKNTTRFGMGLKYLY